ncbi:serine/threonine-protein kinase RsbW [Geosporobacter subterraneus DSM 17957]|uniref:Serine/threonine-protein kinase RsbW n=1 Tax=Geosporobacter subterraneus DSM 17957 TaxID=1121919 RepID=A0A1M6IZU4_9FIRM|nr:ATP-binding protein [Geosporobacter subterraneus]SHJ39986.1 serine/threonine-protein kinase RsbW [Geosporobacter subterraneus DSM 17957]
MGDSLSISIPSKPEYVSVVRLTTSAIASRMGFNVEEIEDIKVAVAEACTNAIIHSNCKQDDNFNIHFGMDEKKIVIQVQDQGNGFYCEAVEEPDLTSPKEGGLGIFIIKSLMDEVVLESDIGKGTTIKMTKYLGDDI